MLVSSKKAKGRVAQQQVRDALLELGKDYGLVVGDIASVGMGQSGEDIVFSPAARKVFPFVIEVKNVEKLVVPTTFWKHCKTHEKSPHTKLLFHKKNKTKMLVTMQLDDFMAFLKKGLDGAKQ